ncbi:hypothetical protein GCM10010841_02740 [Deinococcus aerophilus]|uniref:Uncharacterized protein n=1 Tax=Deinococcus aerophilus TaxID=522488 RepID=A0ABQ2GIB1_9DEIO|nr:hypothetical protein GCM10010841_02740 [Deinococcus aerophilus]
MLIASVAMILMTQRIHPLRRRGWRLWTTVMFGLTFQCPYFTEVLLRDQCWLAYPLLIGCLARSATLQFRRYARLAHTLTLQGRQA